MFIEDLLLETLDNLNSDDFSRFKYHLSWYTFKDYKPIPKARLDNAKAPDIVRTLTEYYMQDLAVNITIDILKKMNNNHTAGQLQQKYKGEILSWRKPNGDTFSFFL